MRQFDIFKRDVFAVEMNVTAGFILEINRRIRIF
jgi:hypothetical protein